MIANFTRILVLVLLVLLSSFVTLWVLLYLHTYINGNFIPDQLRWENGRQRTDSSNWMAVARVIGCIEWLGLLWLCYKVNTWYSREWSDVYQRQVVVISTGLVGVLTGLVIWYFQ